MKSVFSLCAVAALVCLLVVGAGAVTVTVDKHDYKSGEIISSHVVGMTMGVNYSMKVTTDQFMKPGMPSAFGSTNVTWPFSLENDSFNVTNVNTTQNSVIIRDFEKDGKSYKEAVFNGTSTNGVFTRTFAFDHNETGMYTSQWIATPAAGAPIVTSIFWINGTKLTGSVDFTAESSITTVNPAVAWLEIYENNVLATRDRFTIDAVDVPANLVPTLLPGSDGGSESYPGSGGAATTTTASGSGSGSGSGATVTPTGPSGTATSGATPAVTATSETTGTATAMPTPTPTGSPFALAALGALGCAALLLAGRVRR